MKKLLQASLIILWVMSAMACGGSSSSPSGAITTPTNETKNETDPAANPDPDTNPKEEEKDPSPQDTGLAPTDTATLSACAADLFTRQFTNKTVIPTEQLNPKDAYGLTVKKASILNHRTIDITFTSDHLTRAATARVVLPANYSTHYDYPVLYLLHGGGGTHEDWTWLDAEQTTANAPIIVVQIDGGKGSWFANAKFPSPNGDWLAEGLLEQNVNRFINGFRDMDFKVFLDALNPIPNGPPKWESYIIEQLIPWVDDNLSTRGQRDGRAIAGLSMGGYGAMSYITRYPELFVAGAAFSGAVDTTDTLISQWVGVSPLIEGRLPYTIFGPYGADINARQAHNPTMNVSNLLPWRDDVHLAFYYGNGNAGELDFTPLDEAQSFVPDPIKWLTEGVQDLLSNTQLLLPDLPNRLSNPMGWIQEQEVHQMNLNMQRELAALGIPYQDHGYGDGMHTGTYWKRSLQQELPHILNAFGALPPAPISRARAVVGKNAITDGNFEMPHMGPWQCTNTCGKDGGLGFAFQGENNGYATGTLGRNEIRQTVNVLPHHNYQFKAWVRTSDNLSNGYVGVRELNGANVKRLLLSPYADYTELIIEFDTKEHTTLEVYANVKAEKGKDTWLQIDDVSLITYSP